MREVEDTIQRKAQGREADSLHAEMLERLDSLDEAIDDRPIAELISDICHDLGIAHLPGSHPWQRGTLADVAALHLRAASVRHPEMNGVNMAPTPPPSGVPAPARLP